MANTNEDQLSQTGRSYYKIGDNGNWWEGYDGSSWIDTGEEVNVPGPIYIQGIQGPRGPQGSNADPIPGPKGDPGPAGPEGPEGPRGPQGVQGTAGKDFSIAKTFTSIDEMIASGGEGLTEGDFVMISTDIQDEDNAKMFLWNGNAFTYVSDLSGATGIKGDKGDQGVKGEQGIQGIQGPPGPQGTPGKDGTNADSAYKTITIEGSPLDLSQGVRTFTAFDSKTGENIPNFSVNIISSNWTSKYHIHRLTFLQSPMSKAAGLDTYSAVVTESSSAIHDCDVYGSLDIQDNTRAMQLKLVPADLTVNHKAFDSNGNAQIDATNIEMGGGSTQLISEAIASKADATNVVTSVNGYKGDAYVVSPNIVLNQRTDNTLYFSWLEDGSLKNTEINNIQIVNVLTSAPIQLTAPSVEVSFGVGYIHMYKDKDDSTVTCYSGATMASTLEDYTMRYIDFTVSESGFTNVLLYLEPTNAPIDVLPITKGGTGRTDGISQGAAIGQLGSTDLNTLVPNGSIVKYYNVWGGTPSLNYPIGGVKGILEVGKRDGNTGYQIFHDTQHDYVFYRRFTNNGSNWGGWSRLDETSVVISNGTDLNDLRTTGRYHAGASTGLTNTPEGVSAYFTLVVDSLDVINNTNGSQTIFNTNSGKMYTRTWNSSGGTLNFSPWKEMFGSTDVIPIANGGTGNTTGSAKDLVTSYIPANSDLDTYLTAGWYRNTSATGITNMPPEMIGTWFFLEVMNVNSANVIQRYYGISSGKWFMRRYYSSPAVWSDWKEIYSGNSIIPIENGGTGRTDGLVKSLYLNTIASNTDLNTLTTAGYYNYPSGAAGITNGPVTNPTYFAVTVENITGATIMQTIKFASNIMYTRTRSGDPLVWSDWKRVGEDAGSGGTGNLMYSGRFNILDNRHNGDDGTFIVSYGAGNILQSNGGLVTQVKSGTATFTNPTPEDIEVFLTPSYTINQKTGTATSHKYNAVVVDRDVQGGTVDASNIGPLTTVLYTSGYGGMNFEAKGSTVFTVPANGVRNVAFRLNTYGGTTNIYAVDADMSYVAYRKDNKVMTEELSVPWTKLTGTNSGTAGEYKKIGSWTVVRWDFRTTQAGSYFLGSLPPEACPSKGIISIVSAWSVTASDNVHIQVNTASDTDPGRVQLLSALTNTLYRAQFIFNNDGSETVSVPYLADYDVLLPNNKVVVGQITDGIGTEYAMDPSVGMYAKTRDFQSFLLSSGLLINTLNSSGDVLKSYNWNPISGVKLANDVPWTDFPLNTIEWVNQGGDWTCRYKVTNNTLYVEGRIHSIQQVPVSTQNVNMGTVPGIALDRNTTYTCRTTNGLDVHIDVSKTGKFTFQGAWNGGAKSAMGTSDLLNMSFTIPLIDL